MEVGLGIAVIKQVLEDQVLKGQNFIRVWILLRGPLEIKTCLKESFEMEEEEENDDEDKL